MHNLAGIKNFIQKNTRARNSRNIVEILWPCAALAQEITTLHVKDNPLDKPSYYSKSAKSKKNRRLQEEFIF